MSALLDLIDLILALLFWVLFIYVILGLLINFGIVNAYNRVVSAIYEFLMRVCEPVLRPVRRILPSVGAVDLSPMVVAILIWFLRRLLNDNREAIIRAVTG